MIKASSDIKLKGGRAGQNLANTFLMIKNVSDINKTEFKVRVTGMRKVKEEVETKEGEEKMNVE